ncbi:MAG: hypothetical protein U0835_13910 [Isosphaeraceae bacterium]
MSPKNSLLTAGLTALGMFGIAGLTAAVPQDPAAPSASAPAAAGATAAETPASPRPAVLLLSNGQIIQGSISREGNEYVIRQRAGTIRFPESRVEKACASVAEVYEYKKSLVPDDDPDEHLKLARWCLSQNLMDLAKLELQAVLKVSGGSAQARAMLGMIEAKEARLAASATPRVDGDLVQTGAEGDDAAPGSAQRPEELDPALLRRASRDLRLSASPVIFDLPPVVAVARYQQFARSVHPVLQASCVSCHNENYDGKFQLYQVKSRKALTQDVLRANLDATLQFIDADNPSKSELLSSVLLPHGGTASKRPIFRGSNDPRFQILSAWVNSLRAPRTADPAARLTRQDGGFGSERNATAPQFTPTPSNSLIPPNPFNSPEKVPGEVGSRRPDFGPMQVIPSSRYEPGKGMVVEKNAPAANEFPAPYMAGGPRPTIPMPKQGQTAAGPASGPAPAVNPAALKQKGGDLSAGVPYTPGMLPGVVVPGEPATPLPPAEEPEEPEAPKTAKKPVKLDPSLLEKALNRRNQAPR